MSFKYKFGLNIFTSVLPETIVQTKSLKAESFLNAQNTQFVASR